MTTPQKSSLSAISSAEWVLRIAVFGEFIGHGILAIQGKQAWIDWIVELMGTDAETAVSLLLIVGILDVALGLSVLFLRGIPRVLLLWMALWGAWTALLRPIMGDSILDFIERWPNWGAPLALIFLYGWPKTAKEWFTPQSR